MDRQGKTSDGMFWLALIVTAFLVLLCSTVYGDVALPVTANDDTIKGRVLFGEPNEGMVGFFGEWDDRAPEHLWAAGVSGRMDVSDEVTGVLDRFLGTPSSWWELLDALGAQAYVWADVGPCALPEDPQASATIGVGARLGPFLAEAGYRFLEGGGVALPDGDELVSGMTYTIGVQWSIRWK